MLRHHRLKVFCMILVTALLSACSSSTAPAQPEQAKKTYDNLVVGYAQIGAESDWRTANTLSIQESAQDLGVALKFSDAQQSQDNQIRAIRDFIAQKVDVIGISPIVADGWDEVFGEAKAAGIPIILVDRQANVSEDLYTAYIGSDFTLEGQKACEEMALLLNKRGNIIEMEGTVGSAPATQRKAGFHECLKQYPDMHVIESITADFTRAKGKTVMADLIKKHGSDINALYAHNDDMALGAIEALTAAGFKPGDDVKIVSVDAVKDAFQAMIDGTLNVTVECNPLLGPQFFETALKVANGDPVERWVKSNEGVFRQATASADIAQRRY